MHRLTLAILTLWLLTAPTQASTCRALSSQGLKRVQVETLHRAFEEGRENDMSYSLAAIVWKESSGGVLLENPKDPSSGAFMVLTENALHYAGWEDTEANRQVMYNILQYDFETSAQYAMLNLKFWMRAYKVSWRKAYQYYNGGRSYSAASIRYSKDIVGKIRVIKKCGW